MIDWLRRVDPSRPFLKLAGEAVTYGEAFGEIRRRALPDVRVLAPGPDLDSVLDCLAGISGGGLVVAGPGVGPPAATALDGARLVVFTSGTSGVPKGVRLTMANLEAAAVASMDHLGHGEDDTWLLDLPLHHVAGLSILVRQAYAGGSVRILGGFDQRAFATALRGDVTMASMVPTMLTRLLDEDPGPYLDLRAVLVGGGPIPGGLLERAAEAGLPVLPTYGMTETFGQLATLRPGSPLDHKAHPLPGVEVRIEPGGRIAVRGPQVSPGYLGEPDRAVDWLVTNDLGVIDDDGALRVLGRADAVIVTGGENVHPERVEAELREHPGVRDALVVGIPDPEWGWLVACLYTGDAGDADLESWARSRLAPFMVPKRWLRVETIPLTPLGKPDRSAGAACAKRRAHRA